MSQINNPVSQPPAEQSSTKPPSKETVYQQASILGQDGSDNCPDGQKLLKKTMKCIKKA